MHTLLELLVLEALLPVWDEEPVFAVEFRFLYPQLDECDFDSKKNGKV
jgi:hypothetical protein